MTNDKIWLLESVTMDEYGELNGSGTWYKGIDKDFEAVKNQAIQALESYQSPCDLCKYNPPSSTDGKPCCMCPAEGKK